MNAHAVRAAAFSLSLIATAWLVITPAYRTSSETLTASGGPAALVPVRSGRLLDANPRAALVLAVPMILSVCPLFFQRHRARRSVTLAAAAVLTVACIPGSMTIGLFYLPSALALWLAGVLDGRTPPATCLLFAALFPTGALDAQSALPAPALIALGATRVRETGDLLINRPSAIAAGARGTVFVSDIAEGRVLQIARTGTVERAIGKKGRGPGELVSPGAIAVSGDTLLAVFDGGSRQVSFFSLGTGQFIKSVPVPVTRPAMAFRGAELLLTTYDTRSKGTVIPVTIAGGAGATEGVLPPIILRLPMLADAFWNAVIVADGDDVLTSFEVSSVLIRSSRGARIGTAIQLPAVRRRGVDESLYDEMVRDPSAARRIAYAHSVPMAAQFISRGVLALATVDPTQAGARFTGVYHVTLVDFARKTVCPDLAVPVATDPMPHLAFRGDTLVVLVQPAGASGDAASELHRFRIDPKRCKWQALPTPKRVGE